MPVCRCETFEENAMATDVKDGKAPKSSDGTRGGNRAGDKGNRDADRKGEVKEQRGGGQGSRSGGKGRGVPKQKGRARPDLLSPPPAAASTSVVSGERDSKGSVGVDCYSGKTIKRVRPARSGLIAVGSCFRENKGMVIPARFERATPRLGIWCSILLSYGTTRYRPIQKRCHFAKCFCARGRRFAKSRICRCEIMGLASPTR